MNLMKIENIKFSYGWVGSLTLLLFDRSTNRLVDSVLVWLS